MSFQLNPQITRALLLAWYIPGLMVFSFHFALLPLVGNTLYIHASRRTFLIRMGILSISAVLGAIIPAALDGKYFARRSVLTWSVMIGVPAIWVVGFVTRLLFNRLSVLFSRSGRKASASAVLRIIFWISCLCLLFDIPNHWTAFLPRVLANVPTDNYNSKGVYIFTGSFFNIGSSRNIPSEEDIVIYASTDTADTVLAVIPAGTLFSGEEVFRYFCAVNKRGWRYLSRIYIGDEVFSRGFIPIDRYLAAFRSVIHRQRLKPVLIDYSAFCNGIYCSPEIYRYMSPLSLIAWGVGTVWSGCLLLLRQPNNRKLQPRFTLPE